MHGLVWRLCFYCKGGVFLELGVWLVRKHGKMIEKLVNVRAIQLPNFYTIPKFNFFLLDILMSQMGLRLFLLIWFSLWISLLFGLFVWLSCSCSKFGFWWFRSEILVGFISFRRKFDRIILNYILEMIRNFIFQLFFLQDRSFMRVLDLLKFYLVWFVSNFFLSTLF